MCSPRFIFRLRFCDGILLRGFELPFTQGDLCQILISFFDVNLSPVMGTVEKCSSCVIEKGRRKCHQLIHLMGSGRMQAIITFSEKKNIQNCMGVNSFDRFGCRSLDVGLTWIGHSE